MCALCFETIGKWLSPACYRRHEAVYRTNRMQQCILCKAAWARSETGSYCLRCAARQKRAQRHDALTAEARGYLDQRHAAGCLPAATPPAMNFLRWPTPAPNLREYQDTAAWLPAEHCRICFQAFAPLSLDEHLRAMHSMNESDYRQAVMRDAMSGLRPVPVQLLRQRLAAYTEQVMSSKRQTGVCGACARFKPSHKLTSVVLGCPNAVPQWLGWTPETWIQHKGRWMNELDHLLRTETYWETYFHGPARLAEATQEHQAAIDKTDALGIARAEHWLARVQAWARHTQKALADDSIAAPEPLNSRWLLFAPACGSVALDNESTGIACILCHDCRGAISKLDAQNRPVPRLGRYCRASGLWAGPEPEPIRNLNWLGRRILQLARAVVCIKHLPRSLHSIDDPAAMPMYFTGNVHVFPQKGGEISRALGLLPLDLCCDLGVQFPGSHIPSAVYHPDMRVNLQSLRSALWWYTTHNWEWMVATKDDYVPDRDHLGSRLEHLLQQYRNDGLHEQTHTTPNTLLQSCTVTAGEPDAPSSEQQAGLADDTSAAYLDAGVEDTTPLGLWTAAMRKYDVLIQCENRLLHRHDAGTDLEANQRARSHALWEAVQALQKLSTEVAQQLRDFEQQRQEHGITLHLGKSNVLLDSRDPCFWSHCFCDLFYRADCQERHRGSMPLHGRQWARALLKRADFKGWASSKEFAAVAANVFMRRHQMAAIHSWLRIERGFARIQDTLSTLSVEEFVAAAAAQKSDFSTLAHALQCKPSHSGRLHQLFREMTIVLRDIDGSEAHRSATIYKMRALRVWSGCSFLFFTLNPVDHSNPIFVAFLNSQTNDVEQIKLNCSDTDMHNFFDRAQRSDKQFFQKMVGKHPCAAMRCVRYVMERTIDTLLNCSPPANAKNVSQRQHLDLIAANTEPGVWQHIAAYFGVIETTKTLREHLHMLVHLVGFAHPEDIFKDASTQPLTVTCLLSYTPSICLDAMAFIRSRPLLS